MASSACHRMDMCFRAADVGVNQGLLQQRSEEAAPFQGMLARRRRRRRRPRLLGQGVASCNRGQTTSDGLAKRGGRRGNGSWIELRARRGLTAFVTRHGDGSSGHITCERSLALCHISGNTLSRRLLRRQSRDGDRCFLVLLDPNLAQRRCERFGDRRRDRSFLRLCRCKLLRCSPPWRSIDRRHRDQEPHFLKTCDFSIESRNNFLSIHRTDILNHTAAAANSSFNDTPLKPLQNMISTRPCVPVVYPIQRQRYFHGPESWADCYK